jgi:hypothetical protein
MKIRMLSLPLVVVCSFALTGCGGLPVTSGSRSAAIVGSVVPAGAAGKALVAAQSTCPDVEVELNGSPVNVQLDDRCSFLVDEVQPAANVELRVHLPSLGVSGSIELGDVEESELIEILVEAGDTSLSVAVVRRAGGDPDDELPAVIDANNVSVHLAAGTYDQTLTVNANNFTLTGEAGDDCNDSGWSVITGQVVVDGNNAMFRDIRFDGPVEVRGNNAAFINCCFGDQLVVFGNRPQQNGGHDDDDDDDDGDDDVDDNDDDD